MSCENCLNRRAFLAKSAAVAAAAALAAGCGDGNFGPPLPTHSAGGVPSGSLTIKVSNFPGLATVGTLVTVGTERAAVRTSVSPPAFLALSLICTHQGCDAAVTTTNIVQCPCHGSQFDHTGAVIQGPATQPLHEIATTYNAQTDELTIG